MKKLLIRWHRAWLALWLAVPLAAQVVINELHYNPPGSGDEIEFIEFWNIGVTTVSLAGTCRMALIMSFPPARASRRVVFL